MSDSERRIMTHAEMGWLAGIIEGEGFIGLSPTWNSVNIQVQMMDEDVVHRLAEVTGAGTVRVCKLRPGHSRPIWRWQVGAQREVARILLAIAPMMGKRRLSRIGEAADRLKMARPCLPIAACGTLSGRDRHFRLGEKPCDPCRLAKNAYERNRRKATS